MMGRKEAGQAPLFYSFNLEDHVPATHLLRGVDRFLDLSELHQHLAPHYSHTGRPSIDPVLIIRMLIVGYCFGIRSERRLCEEVHLNLAYRWFCKLGLEDSVPDHSTFSKNRHGRFRDNVKADANRQRGVPGSEVRWPDETALTRPVREYLAALDAAEEERKRPKNISLTDPASQWTAAPGGPAFYAYSTNYLIDVQAGIIMDVEASPAHRTEEVNATKKMIERVEKRFDITPKHLIGDTAYGTAAMLGWMVDEKAIEPHVPVWEKGERDDGTLGRSDFRWDAAADEYRCPNDKALRSTGNPTSADTLIYRSSVYDCLGCELKSRCCPNTTHRKIPRQVNEGARDVAREISKTARYQQSRKDRKKVEMLFAHLKRILRLDRLRLRGLLGAQDEFLLAATAQNLRRMARWLTPKAQRTAIAVPI